MSLSPGTGLFSGALLGQTLAPCGSNVILAEWRARGTTPGEAPELIAPRHVHHEDDEAWYVLEGTLGFELGDTRLEVGAGGAAVAPRGTPHTFWNPGSAPCRYLIVMTPQIKALIDATHAAPERSPETMRRLFELHGSELL
ncbi:cupin domain-containing protein [Paenibacillus filicis]|uniref:Cupin domain-containing protein n=1 Tax=Paenibacillus gyeongsangnamensis TaxID=3388067 RepID=A0ABT4QB54_9BACL|nr:cupin domain-containing protein [Paenibacillus filicis]MCZ8514081.1 cupin domain-containing protein [Paenibacillus filicis]